MLDNFIEWILVNDSSYATIYTEIDLHLKILLVRAKPGKELISIDTPFYRYLADYKPTNVFSGEVKINGVTIDTSLLKYPSVRYNIGNGGYHHERVRSIIHAFVWSIVCTKSQLTEYCNLTKQK